MVIGVLRESDPLDSRVALTPPVVRHLVERGNTVWVASGAGNGAMYADEDYLRAGAQIGSTPADVIRHAGLLLKMSVPTPEEMALCARGTAFMAFFHLAAAEFSLFERLTEHGLTAVGYEIIETGDGRLPVLAAASEMAGQMTVPLAAHLLRSTSGGRGILLGGSPGVPPAHVVIIGAGTVGSWAARTARAAGARVTVLDADAEKLRYLMATLPNVATAFSEPESLAAAVADADVLIGAVLIAGARSPHVVTQAMVESMKPGAVVIDVSIDQGGCIETSRPTTIAEPTFVHAGIVHYCVPNLTAEMGRSASTAIAQAMLPYLSRIGADGLDAAVAALPELARGVYTYKGECVHAALARTWHVPRRDLARLITRGGASAAGQPPVR